MSSSSVVPVDQPDDTVVYVPVVSSLVNHSAESQLALWEVLSGIKASSREVSEEEFAKLHQKQYGLVCARGSASKGSSKQSTLPAALSASPHSQAPVPKNKVVFDPSDPQPLSIPNEVPPSYLLRGNGDGTFTLLVKQDFFDQRRKALARCVAQEPGSVPVPFEVRNDRLICADRLLARAPKGALEKRALERFLYSVALQKSLKKVGFELQTFTDLHGVTKENPPAYVLDAYGVASLYGVNGSCLRVTPHGVGGLHYEIIPSPGARQTTFEKIKVLSALVIEEEIVIQQLDQSAKKIELPLSDFQPKEMKDSWLDTLLQDPRVACVAVSDQEIWAKDKNGALESFTREKWNEKIKLDSPPAQDSSVTANIIPEIFAGGGATSSVEDSKTSDIGLSRV